MNKRFIEKRRFLLKKNCEVKNLEVSVDISTIEKMVRRMSFIHSGSKHETKSQ